MKFSYFSVPFVYLAFIYICIISCDNKPSNQSSPDKSDSIKKIILNIQQQMQSAYSDSIHGAEKFAFFCEDSVITTYEGNYESSSYALSHDLPKGTTIPPHKFIFRLFDKTVLLSFLVTNYEIIQGDTIYHDVRETKTFILDKGNWKMAAMCVDKQPINYFNPVRNTNTNRYKEFEGVYQWSKSDADTFFIKNDKLYSAFTGNPPVLNFAINDSEYMPRNGFEKIVFGKDNKGKVSYYTCIMYDGQKIKIPKVK